MAHIFTAGHAFAKSYDLVQYCAAVSEYMTCQGSSLYGLPADHVHEVVSILV